MRLVGLFKMKTARCVITTYECDRTGYAEYTRFHSDEQ